VVFLIDAHPSVPFVAVTRGPKQESDPLPTITHWEVPKPEVIPQMETPPPPPPPPPVEAHDGLVKAAPPAPAPPAPIATTSIQNVPGQQDQVPLDVKHWVTMQFTAGLLSAKIPIVDNIICLCF
jgi:hypothetical protein